MSREQPAGVVTALLDILAVLRDADPADKAEIYSQLGLRLTYQPGRRIVRAEARLDQTPHWVYVSRWPRGDRTHYPMPAIRRFRSWGPAVKAGQDRWIWSMITGCLALLAPRPGSG